MQLNSSHALRALFLILIAFTSGGCAVIEGIFKAGVWVGVAIVLVILALLAWAIKAARR